MSPGSHPPRSWGPCKSGWDEVSPVFRGLASRFSGVSDYTLELVAAGIFSPERASRRDTRS